MLRRLPLLALLALAAMPAAARQTTYANPVDLDYRYNFEQEREGISYRTGADPAVVNHRGVYYLFLTLAEGYWRSTDLIHWTFIKPSRWPFDGLVAPAVESDGKRLYVKPSTMRPGPILVSDAPDTGKLDFLTRLMPPIPNGAYEGDPHPPADSLPPGPWDPDLFRDDDGKWYLYWNSSNVYPLYGIELDPKQAMAYRGTAKPLIALDPARHGWERFGQDHTSAIKPFIEGAWMTRHAGKYYLQYAAPGTEYNVYATGAYVGASPLGDFTYAAWNPVAYKPGGFVTGAGHGSTFRDNAGRYWLTGTPWIGYNWPFERRVGLWPVTFYPDGQMAANTRFGDFPHVAATGAFTGWMLLSYRKPAVASSTLGEFAASRTTDEDPRSFWVAAANRPGETLTVDLGAVATVRAVQVDFADYKAGRFGDAPDIYTEFTLMGSADGKTWRRIGGTDAPRRDRPNAYVELARPERLRYVRYVHSHVGAAYLAIADLRVFGTTDGRAPATPMLASAERHADQRDATIRWAAVPGAVGYNIRWGIAPDRLVQTYQRWADQGTTLDLRALTVGQPYYVAVEAFNASGVSGLSATKGM
ncbi:MAG: family 43 glycosylhydrolase [Sphingomonas sp.]|uniref:family 43 glycosylhydrolase n=1 Tax=Sphingomonas sp. TaxID=28214 RepID=UPI001AC207D0|nr:family 43 glycosylhydrolase [Sphingomonas sp.]MBN8807143.1 family 43 glycosylhydrolase [Sphingomonas sp.]